jgi:hypothetical protein
MDETREKAEPDTPAQPVRKRSWFRFHLSTAIIVMFTAGLLLWANFTADIAWPMSDWGVDVYLYGWPKKVEYLVTQKTAGLRGEEARANAMYDACVALGILAAAGVASEFVTRMKRAPAKATRKQLVKPD